MEKEMKLKVRKELDGRQQSNIIKLIRKPDFKRIYGNHTHSGSGWGSSISILLILRAGLTVKYANSSQHLLPGSSLRTVSLFLSKFFLKIIYKKHYKKSAFYEEALFDFVCGITKDYVQVYNYFVCLII